MQNIRNLIFITLLGVIAIENAYSQQDHQKQMNNPLSTNETNCTTGYPNHAVAENGGFYIDKNQIELLKERAENNDSEASYKLYFFYNFYAYDYNQAIKWLKKAAEQGKPIAQYNLAKTYEMGWGVSKDYTEAIKWYEKAVFSGEKEGSTKLVDFYLNGKGVKKDIFMAYVWLLVECNGIDGDSEIGKAANIEKQQVAKQLIPEQLKLAKEKAESLLKKIKI
jgi:TPR repeat protein